MTIFSKIAAGEIPSYKCAENEQFYAFLDIDPVTKGHTLVVPRKEVDYIYVRIKCIRLVVDREET